MWKSNGFCSSPMNFPSNPHGSRRRIPPCPGCPFRRCKTRRRWPTPQRNRMKQDCDWRYRYLILSHIIYIIKFWESFWYRKIELVLWRYDPTARSWVKVFPVQSQQLSVLALRGFVSTCQLCISPFEFSVRTDFLSKWEDPPKKNHSIYWDMIWYDDWPY